MIPADSHSPGGKGIPGILHTLAQPVIMRADLKTMIHQHFSFWPPLVLTKSPERSSHCNLIPQSLEGGAIKQTNKTKRKIGNFFFQPHDASQRLLSLPCRV